MQKNIFKIISFCVNYGNKLHKCNSVSEQLIFGLKDKVVSLMAPSKYRWISFFNYTTQNVKANEN